ncbi:MAG: FG-GAP repeat protein [Vicinamibacteria bacterium]
MPNRLFFVLALVLTAFRAQAGPVEPDLPVAAEGALSAALGRDDARYVSRPAGAGFTAANPRQGFRVEYGGEGPTLVVGEETLALRLSGLGRGDRIVPVADVPPRAVANRVEYTRAGVAEWYANGPFGLQQGFRVERRPDRAAGGPLALELALSGSLAPRLDGQDLALVMPDGATALVYRGLTAADDRGRSLPTSLVLTGGVLRIEVDDRGAVYPILVDPSLKAARLTASDGASDDFFGFAVAMDGDTIVVGAKEDDGGAVEDRGAAYVFVRPAGGWRLGTEAAKLIASDGSANDQFGISVAVSGDDVFVGSWNDDNTGLGGPGSVYVFTKPAAGWSGVQTQTARLVASDRQAGDLLGAAVAASGNVLVAGAPFDDNAFGAQGSAYVFVRPPGGWQNATEAAKLVASDPGEQDRLGSAVAVDGDTIVLGAPLDDVGAQNDRGSAYVFQSASWFGTMTETAKLAAADGLGNDTFGFSVAVDAGTVVSGAILHATKGLARGAVYVFERPSGGWASTAAFAARLTVAEGTHTDRLGESVAIVGDVVVAGARFGPGPNNGDQGAAYVFLRPATGWATTDRFREKLVASDGVASDSFGAAVARSANATVVGAWGHAFGGGPFQGQVYVFQP